MEDLINFDIIETHKENIQSLPGGRSAKALVSTFAPTSTRPTGPTPGDTRNLNDAIREEYELEVGSIADSDDPLDVYDRYVKWTFSAYPSAQATPESQLRPLLERATKAFQSAPHYKNDPRYLKLWLNYIRFFSEAPRETFAYLARHSIGEGLALFYEEFASWLEGAGRWKQADEVYKLGIEREARPTERLLRKFGEFQHRFESRVENADEPSSPALPTVRPALVAKLDPFAVSTPQSGDPQAPRPSAGLGGSSIPRAGRQKIAIFSDSDDAAPALGKGAAGESAKGWDNIGTVAERKKENVIGARPWTGETLKGGKKTSAVPKMAVFKDESSSQISNINSSKSSRYADQQEITNARTGRIERVFVDLQAVYPNEHDPNEEVSFEELRAKSRGWLSQDWKSKRKEESAKSPRSPMPQEHRLPGTDTTDSVVDALQDTQSQTDSQRGPEGFVSPSIILDTTIAVDIARDNKSGRQRRTKVREVKGETQTIKTNLASPTGPKLRRKNSAEPTMTLHTKAATEDILDIFNQPLRNVDPMAGPADSAGESDYDDDDYTSAGESTGTGHISGTSEFGDTEADVNTQTQPEDTDAAVESVSPWSDFTASKHVPGLDARHGDEEEDSKGIDHHDFVILEDPAQIAKAAEDDDIGIITPNSPQQANEYARPKYVPIPPEDYEPPTRPYKDSVQVQQNRLPFMTPIVEKTESSMGALTIREEKDYFNSKTPSRQRLNGLMTPAIDSSPLQEIVNEASPPRAPKFNSVKQKSAQDSPAQSSIIIRDAQCNPVDDSIRNNILERIEPALSSYQGYHDYGTLTFNRATEIRKFIKSLAKSRSASDKTTTSFSLPPVLHFPQSPSKTHIIKRELGKGAFAPVYLASEEDATSENNHEELIAVKCEHPPTSWEFYIMSLLHQRLSNERASSSLLRPHALHLFADEAYLLESYLDQGTLLDLVNSAKVDHTSANTTGTLDETVAMFFTIELLRTVEAMHSIGILHGDLKADNCLVRLPTSSASEEWDPQYHPDGNHGWDSKGLCLIDFGRGIDLRSFRPDVQFVADWKTGKQDCVEMRELRPWTYQVDYFGIAGVVHSLLFGKYIEDVGVDAAASRDSNDDGADRTIGIASRKKYKLREGLKRYWQTELWGGLFELLLNPTSHVDREEGGKMPCTKGLRECRESMERWLEGEGGRRSGGLKNALRKIEERIKERKGGK